MAGHRAQQDRAVAHRARERPGLIERGREGDDAPARAAAVGRLDADDAGERGRLADRAAGVGAGRAEAQLRRDRRRRAAGRAARHQRRVRALRAATATITGPKNEVSFDEPMANSSLLVLPSITAPSRQSLRGDGRLVGRHEIVEDVRARGGAHALGAEHVLDAERDAFERAAPRLSRCARRRPCAIARAALRRLQHIGVERARLLDRGEMRVGEFGRGELLLAQRRRAPAPR